MEEQVIEQILKEYPIYQYTFVDTTEVSFSEKVRYICEHECERYGKSWSCPPAVGTVEECQQKCAAYDRALVFSTVGDASEAYDMDSVLRTRGGHEDITQEIIDQVQKNGMKVLALSTESCDLCKECGYPHHSCRFPHQMHPCIESYGIVLTPLLEKTGLDFNIEEPMVLWFSILFFRNFK